ncbi:hypothetical protein CCP3SC1_800005 [Gammaproteobacteria bacterium]
MSSLPASLTDPTIIDLRILAARFKGDPEKVEKYARKFIESVTKGLTEMDEAWSQQDVIMLKRVAHRIKSVAGTVGAIGFSERCQELDNCNAAELSASVASRLKELHELFDIIVAQLFVMIPPTLQRS